MSSGSKQASVSTDSCPGGDRVVNLLQKAVHDELLSGACVLASVGDDVFLSVAEGNRALGLDSEAPPQPIANTVFDLGRLTQGVCTATLMMRLVSLGKVSLTDRAARYLQGLGVGQKSKITLAHLLSHTTGFPAGISVYDELVKANAGPRPGILSSSGAKQYAYNHFKNATLRFEPGARVLESDINYVILGEICELVTGLSLEKAFVRYVATPMQLGSINFIDLTILRRRRLEPIVELFSPMGICSRRGRVIAGEVWDENAWVMGGVAGHAGLFGTVGDLHKWGRALLDAVHGRSDIIAPEVATMFLGSDERVGCGFMSASKEDGFSLDESNGSHGRIVMNGTGGSSVFLDCARDMVVVFLSGMPLSHQNTRKLNALRTEVLQAILQ